MWVANVVEYRDHMLVFQQERHAIEPAPSGAASRESRKAFERSSRARCERAGVAAASGVDSRLALVALLGMVNHTAQWYRPRGRLAPSEIADGYLELVLGEA